MMHYRRRDPILVPILRGLSTNANARWANPAAMVAAVNLSVNIRAEDAPFSSLK